MSQAIPKPPDVSTAVEAFNRKYGTMDTVVWDISKVVRSNLLNNDRSELTADFVWLVRSWMGIQGPPKSTKDFAARVLHRMQWASSDFIEAMDFTDDAQRHAVQLVAELTESMLGEGASRREFSLASKVLHWILPWRIPIYDSFVRTMVGAPTSAIPRDAYREIVTWEYHAAERLLAQDASWMGQLEPRSPLHALDKYLWWVGGGDKANAVLVKDPEKVLRRFRVR